jgi:hypothetical protein
MSAPFRKVLPWLCVVISFAAGFGSGYYSAPQSRKQPATDWFWLRVSEISARRRAALDEAAKLVKIEEWRFDRLRRMPAVVGTLMNGSDRTLNVTVTFNIYDNFGVQVGSTDARVRNLEAGSKGRFEAVLFPDKSAVTARLHKIEVD